MFGGALFGRPKLLQPTPCLDLFVPEVLIVSGLSLYANIYISLSTARI